MNDAIIYRIRYYSLVLLLSLTGSNLMLQRIMVKKGVAENLSFLSFDPEAALSKGTYVSIITGMKVFHISQSSSA